MTYRLPDDPTSAQKKAALSELSKALADALKLIVARAGESRAAAIEIKGVEADPADQTIWKGGRTFDFTVSNLRADVVHVVASNTRSFVRVIPAAWPVPNINEVQSSSGDVWPNAYGGSMAGNYGPVEFGYVKLWYAGRAEDGSSVATNVAAFHEATGEWWFIDGSSVVAYLDQVYFDLYKVLDEWRRCVRVANSNLDKLGAPNTRKVIVGVGGAQNAVWSSKGWQRKFRKSSMLHSTQNARWTTIDENEFLREAFNKVLNGFAMDPFTQEDFHKILDRK